MLAPIGIAVAAVTSVTPPPRPVVIRPSAQARFQQAVQQNQATHQLQKAQVEQQLHQGAAESARQPHANNPAMQQQIDQAAAAQQQTDNVRQRAIINRYQATPVPQGQVVVPQPVPAAKPASGH